MQRVQNSCSFYSFSAYYMFAPKNRENRDVVKRIGPLKGPCVVCVCELDSSMRVSHQTHVASLSAGVLTSLPDVRRSD